MKTRGLEVVFSASAGHFERLPRIIRTLGAGVKARPLQGMRDSYLDTPTRLLMRAGVACRLRRVGKRATLTLTSLAPFQEGLMDLSECDEELQPGDWSWPAPLPGREIRARLRPLTRRLDVVCLFEAEQHRRLYDVRTQDGAHLEVAADGAGLAGVEGGEKLHHIKIALREGSIGSLWRFANGLEKALKLKPAKVPPFIALLRAVGLSEPAPAEGAALRIRPGDATRKAAARALALHFRHLVWHVPGTRLGINPECLHDMRVSLRRLRASLRLFRDYLPPSLAERVAAELQWLGQSLGGARDLDVHLQKCTTLLGQRPETVHAAVETCRREMGRRRERAHDSLCRDLKSVRFQALKKGCRDLIRKLQHPLTTEGGAIAVEGASIMEAELQGILAVGRDITDDSPDEALHHLRIRCRNMRYACEILGDVYGKPFAKMARRLTSLQDVLGAHQDAVMAPTLIKKVRPESAPWQPGGVDFACEPECCAAVWREEQLVHRAAFPGAWREFDRKKTCRSFHRVIRKARRGKLT